MGEVTLMTGGICGFCEWAPQVVDPVVVFFVYPGELFRLLSVDFWNESKWSFLQS